MKDFKSRVNVCFGKNDVRCVAGKELDEEIAYKTGRAVVTLLRCKEFIVGHDMRVSSHKLRNAFIRGIVEQGADVIDVHAIDSPGLYFVSGFLKKPGGMITASHNPAEYNGIKLTRAGAIPIGDKTGLMKVKELVTNGEFKESNRKGKVRKRDLSKEYRKHVRSFANVKGVKGLKIVVDAGNGMGGKMVPIVYEGLKVKMTKLGFKLDGSFPNHDANPAKPENIKDLISKVKKVKSDFGIAFDGDMDRVFFVDERGQDVDSSIVAGMLIDYLCVGKGGNVVYNTVMSRIVPERVKLHGGKAYKERVGHAFIKERMKKTNSIFGAESSAHYYYGDNWYADSGLITSLIICEIMSRAKKIRKKFSDIAKEYEKYYKIIEKSFRVGDKKKVMEKVEERFRKRAKRVEKKDGLTMEFSWGWFNVRASNTEPLLRLNLEAKTKGEMVRRKLELIEFIGGKI